MDPAMRIWKNEAGRELYWFGLNNSLDDKDIVLGSKQLLKRATSMVEPGLDPYSNSKLFFKGRGSSGIHIWLRENLDIMIGVEVVDMTQQFVALRISGTRTISFLVISYFAPPGAFIYESTGEGDPFTSLTRVVSRLQEIGLVWAVGDYNSRTKSAPCGDLADSITRRKHDYSDTWAQMSADPGRNQFAEAFLRFVSVYKMTILNGTRKSPETQGFMYQSIQGRSTTDYIFASQEARNRIVDFSLLPFQPESIIDRYSCQFRVHI
ncbi:hypothetical protein R1sor_002165 [Riccia sorocarpa]|uniref:Endonuclease/exonuclease/phosphatase domain-containing protein n=1 Tax=Riccia sorocarpa TaxID=122646 RepID=A0ABD3GYU7_9MARC